MVATSHWKVNSNDEHMFVMKRLCCPKGGWGDGDKREAREEQWNSAGVSQEAQAPTPLPCAPLSSPLNKSSSLCYGVILTDVGEVKPKDDNNPNFTSTTDHSATKPLTLSFPPSIPH